MKIGISGAFSTGKTTLLNLLKKEKLLSNFNFIDELAREYLEKHNLNASSIEDHQRYNLEKYILEKQFNIEKQNKNLVIDNTICEMLAYSVGLKSYNDIYQKGIQHIKQYPYDIIFYIPPEINIINDNLRHIDKDFQYLIDTRIKKYLEEIKQYNKNIKILTISGTKLERLTQVKKILDKYI